MNRYEIAKNKPFQTERSERPFKPVEGDAVARAREMMNMGLSTLPPGALEYAQHLFEKYGISSEVALTAYSHYAQAMEGLETEFEAYQLDAEGKRFFTVLKRKLKRDNGTL